MPRPPAKTLPPPTRFGDFARVWHPGLKKKIHLGAWGSQEAETRWRRLSVEYLRNPLAGAHAADGVLLSEILAGYVEWLRRQGKSKNVQDQDGRAAVSLTVAYGDLPVGEFGPRQLKTWAASLADPEIAKAAKWHRPRVDHRGDVALSQKTIKAFCTAALRAIRWAISEEMVTAEETKITSLAETDPLADCRPKRPKKRHPAYQPDIDAVLKELTPTLATAVMIQRATMMRSSELLTMRPMDLRKSGTITLKSGARVRLEWETEQAIERGDIKKGETLWVYVPESHKTAHHGIDKVIPIVPAVQRLLERLPPRDADKPFISPQESLAEFRAMQRARRKTKVQPSQVSRSKAKPSRVPASDQYQQTQYRQAIIRACHRAGVPVWTPHQLRHLGVTDVVDRTGDIRAAQEMAGHSSPRTTEGYTAKTMVKAFRAAAALVSQATEQS